MNSSEKNQLSNTEFKKYKSLLNKKYRQKYQLFIVEGKHLVEEALEAGIVEKIISTSEFKNHQTTITSEERMSALSTTSSPQNIVAICRYLKPKEYRNKILLLNKINDPGNLGTLIRSALSFEFTDVIVEGVDIYNSKVIRSSQGAIFKINCININNSLEFIKTLNDFQIVATSLDKKSNDVSSFNFKDDIALILGNEANGVDKEILSYVKECVYIPIMFESLNVAIAGSIILYEATKKK